MTLPAGIIAAAIEVHKILGPGFQEVVYQRSLFYEMNARGMEFTREAEFDIFYKNKKVGKRRVDFFMDNCLVEIKAKREFDDTDYIQTLSYLKASGKKIGLLINFGQRKLEVKRLVH